MPTRTRARPKPSRPKRERRDSSGELESWIAEYLEQLRAALRAAGTIYGIGRELLLFATWCEAEHSVTRVTEIRSPMLEGYRAHLSARASHRHGLLSATTVYSRVGILKRFFQWLVASGGLAMSPADGLFLRMPPKHRRQPLAPEDVEAMLATCDDSPLGLRDRAMIEILYSTGIRRGELLRLHEYDVDFARGLVTIRLGKGRRDRIVAIGDRALRALEHYLKVGRPELLGEAHDPGLVMVSRRGRALSELMPNDRLRRAAQLAGITKPVSCHILRHTMATAMVHNGADVRVLQELLGHEQLTTTSIYLHVAITDLKAAHEQAHPGNRKVAPKPNPGP